MTPLSIGTISAVAVLLLLSGFLAGYLAGKKQGRFLGYRETLAELPLIIRQKSLDTGECLICSRLLGFCNQPFSYIEHANEKKVRD